jgi:hypothetical protein
MWCAGKFKLGEQATITPEVFINNENITIVGAIYLCADTIKKAITQSDYN